MVGSVSISSQTGTVSAPVAPAQAVAASAQFSTLSASEISAAAGRIATAVQQGPPGAAGTSHGFIVYGEASSAPPIVLASNAPLQLAFPATNINDGILPTSAFKTHVFWDGARLWPRAAGDTAILRLDLSSTALVANGNIEIQLDIGGTQGVIQQVTRALKKPAGINEPISEAFPIFMGPTFLANGGAINLVTSIPAEIRMVSLVIFPLSAA